MCMREYKVVVGEFRRIETDPLIKFEKKNVFNITLLLFPYTQAFQQQEGNSSQ